MAKRLTEAEQWILSYTKEDMKSSFGDPHTLETNLRATGFDGNPIHINISEHPKIKQYIEYILTGKGKSPYEGRRVGYLANGSYHAPKVDGGGDMLWLNNHLIADPIVYNNGARIASNFRFGDSNTPTPTTTPPTTTPPTTTPPTTTPPTTIPPTPSTTVPPTPSTTVPHKRVPAVTGANGNQGSQGSQGAQGGLHVVLTPPGGSGGSSKQPIVTIYGTKPTAGSIEAALQSVFPGLSKGKLDDYRRLIAVSGRDGLSGQQQQTLINIFKASGVSYNLKNKIGIAYRNELSRALGTMFSSYSASYKGQTGSMAPMGQYLQDLVISGAGVNNPLTLAQQAAMDARAAAQAAAAAAREARMQSSIDIISEHLANMGFTDAQLKQLAPFVSSQVHSGITQTAVYADLRRTPQYAQRFPGNAERIKKGLAPFNEPQYIAYEDRTREIAQSYGLPNGALTAANIGHMIANGVSPTEFENRVVSGYEAMQKADPSTLKALQQYYNLNPGDIVHYIIDPKNGAAAIDKKVSAAKIGGSVHDAGLAGINVQEAEKYANFQATKGVNVSQGIQQAGTMKGLMGTAPGQARQGINEQQLLSGAIGTTTAAAQTLAGAQQAQAAPLKAGGGDVASQRGVTGAGYAATE